MAYCLYGIWRDEDDLRTPRCHVPAGQGACRRSRCVSFCIEALEAQLLDCKGDSRTGHEGPPWIAGFGALSDLADEYRRVLDTIEEEFERPVPEDLV